MQNRITLPDKYTETVNGAEISVPFSTDFRTWIRFEMLITDCRIPEDKVLITALRMIFSERMPMDIPRASMFMLWFYRCGDDVRSDHAPSASSSTLGSRRNYSLAHDFGYVAAAFLEKYGIDLWEIPYMHHWKFRALFLGLHDCRFSDICGYRSIDLSEDVPENRRDFLEHMQEIYALPVTANELRRIEAAQRFLDS